MTEKVSSLYNANISTFKTSFKLKFYFVSILLFGFVPDVVTQTQFIKMWTIAGWICLFYWSNSVLAIVLN